MTIAPSSERLAELATALVGVPSNCAITHPNTGELTVGELRWLLAQAERLAVMKPASDDDIDPWYDIAPETYSQDSLKRATYTAGFSDGWRTAERRLLAPPSQPSTSSLPVALFDSEGRPLCRECQLPLSECYCADEPTAYDEAREESERG